VSTQKTTENKKQLVPFFLPYRNHSYGVSELPFPSSFPNDQSRDRAEDTESLARVGADSKLGIYRILGFPHSSPRERGRRDHGRARFLPSRWHQWRSETNDGYPEVVLPMALFSFNPTFQGPPVRCTCSRPTPPGRSSSIPSSCLVTGSVPEVGSTYILNLDRNGLNDFIYLGTRENPMIPTISQEFLQTGPSTFAIVTLPGPQVDSHNSNVGASGSITASADTGGASLPVNISLCQTDPANGQCTSAIGGSVTTPINANATPTFGIFVQGNGNVPFDPAANRVFVRFKDAGGVIRGSTSVAVRTQ
jgi:hypothetical protein